MTDKEQIMINDVDVSECEYLTYQLEEDGQYYWFCNIAPAGGPDECGYKPECFYKKILKQLARKTQECEELKEKLRELELKNTTLQNRNQQLDGSVTKAGRYRKALEEIESIAIKNQRENFYYDGLNELIEITIKLTSDYTLILDIINKAKGGEDKQ